MKDETAIVIKTDLQLGSVQDNFEEVKALVRDEMRQYQDLVFADDDIKNAKTTRASLRKMRTQIDDRRKAIKKQWNEPYIEFENKVKEVLAFIDDPLQQIDVQVKDYEQRQREQKRAEIQEILDEQIGKQPEHVQDVISRCIWAYDERWENATVSLAQVAKQSDEMIVNIAKAVVAIDDGSKHVPQLLGMYEENGDIMAVLSYKRQLEERERQYAKQKEIERQQKQAEEERRQALENLKASQEETRTPEPEAQDPRMIGPAAPDPEEAVEAEQKAEREAPSAERLFTKTFNVTASYDMFKVLIEFMKNSEIKFELVK